MTYVKNQSLKELETLFPYGYQLTFDDLIYINNLVVETSNDEVSND